MTWLQEKLDKYKDDPEFQKLYREMVEEEKKLKEIENFLLQRTWRVTMWDFYHRIMHTFYTIVLCPLNKFFAWDIDFLR